MSLRVLLVDDPKEDADPLLQALRKAGYETAHQRVASAAQMREALDSGTWDIAFCDDATPGLPGMDALRIATDSGLDLPFIFMSREAREQTAVAALDAGAADVVMKGSLGRIGAVVKRVLVDAAARRAMRHAAAEWRATFDSVHDAIFVHDETFRILRANLAYAALARMPVREVIGKRYWEVFPRLSGPLPGCRSQAGEPGTDEFAAPDGHVYSSRSFPMTSERGEYACSVHVLQDVTERNRVRDALESSERRFRALIENSAEVFFVIDGSGRLVYRSESGRQISGYETSDLQGHSVLELVVEEDRAAVGSALAEAAAHPGAVRAMTVKFRRRDGAVRDLDIIVKNCLELPEVGGMVVTARDATGRKRSEEELRRVSLALRALMHAGTEEELYRGCCEAIAGAEAYPLSWIGLARQDAARSVGPVAAAGHSLGYLSGLGVSWSDSASDNEPTGLAIRTGTTQVVDDFATSPALAPWRERAHQHGLASAIALPIRMDGAVIGALMVYSRFSHAFDRAAIALFEELAGDIGYGLETRRMRRAYEASVVERAQAALRLRATFESAIGALAATVEQRDPYTAGHQRRVAQLATAIGRDLGFDEHRLEGLRIAAIIHDIGKIYVPAEILARPGRLAPAEFELIKTHSQVGYDILKGVDFPWPVAEAILQHHERLNGSGYPQGPKCDQVILEARILAVADVVEAMSSHRPYRPGLGIEAALAEIQEKSGTWFDEEVTRTCVRAFREKGFVFTGT